MWGFCFFFQCRKFGKIEINISVHFCVFFSFFLNLLPFKGID